MNLFPSATHFRAAAMRACGATALACAIGFGTAAEAGRSCEPRPPTAASVERGLELATRTHAALETEHRRSGAVTVVIARRGQDLGRYGLRWSHLGFALRDARGVWRVTHKLNACGTAASALYRQGLGQFFLDDPWRYETAWAVPTPEVQARLAPLLADDRHARALHHGPYNLVSYAWGQRYQQSNQWAIETLAAAIEPAVANRAGAQAWLQARDYRPTTLKLGPLTRLGGRVGSANVAFDDHPDERRFAGRIDTVTADSVFEWLQRAKLASEPVLLGL